MDYLIFIILVAFIWFVITATIVQRKFIKKYASSTKERIMVEFTLIPFILFLKRDKELTPWILMVWTSFILFVSLVIINSFAK